VNNVERRQQLLDQMRGLKSSQIGCAKCSGVCCTFVANSMQITPVEAQDLYNFLVSENRFDATELMKNAERFGLTRPEVGDGRRGFSRRRYTCPFKSDKNLGCTIPPKHKPYGCLGFNPQREGAVEGDGCDSDQELLDRRENDEEIEQNIELKSVLDIDWDKKEIPLALIDFDIKFRNSNT
jgi:hypothetical protein